MEILARMAILAQTVNLEFRESLANKVFREIQAPMAVPDPTVTPDRTEILARTAIQRLHMFGIRKTIWKIRFPLGSLM
jgi:hypothetical protein